MSAGKLAKYKPIRWARSVWLGDLNSMTRDILNMGEPETVCIGVREPHKDEVDGETVYRAMRIVELTQAAAEHFQRLQMDGVRWILVRREDIVEGQI